MHFCLLSVSPGFSPPSHSIALIFLFSRIYNTIMNSCHKLSSSPEIACISLHHDPRHSGPTWSWRWQGRCWLTPQYGSSVMWISEGQGWYLVHHAPGPLYSVKHLSCAQKAFISNLFIHSCTFVGSSEVWWGVVGAGWSGGEARSGRIVGVSGEWWGVVEKLGKVAGGGEWWVFLLYSASPRDLLSVWKFHGRQAESHSYCCIKRYTLGSRLDETWRGSPVHSWNGTETKLLHPNLRVLVRSQWDNKYLLN